MKFSDNQFKEFEKHLKIKEASKFQLRSNILQAVHKNNKRKPKRQMGWIFIAISILFLLSSPFYSTTMASVMEKILPISIAPSFSGEQDTQLSSRLYELVESEGYAINSLNLTPSPYTIEISLNLKNSTLKQATEDLEPKIENYLSESGYDKYVLKISETNKTYSNDQEDETDILYDEVRKIVKEVFASYGYAEEADNELVGLKKSWFSNIITLEMPDHIQESNKIINEIEKKIESQELDVKDIEVNKFNLQHRKQDNRWAFISSDIYEGMVGKSTYELTGLSYKVKDGHSYVSIKTNFNEPPSQEIIQEIELSIKEYLSLPETREYIKNDKYTIHLLLKNGKDFIEISS